MLAGSNTASEISPLAESACHSARELASNSGVAMGTVHICHLQKLLMVPRKGVAARWNYARNGSCSGTSTFHCAKESPFTWYALKAVCALFDKSDPRAHYQFPDCARNQHLTGTSDGDHASTYMYGDSSDRAIQTIRIRRRVARP